jgi:1-acyl-sn-glycerol-3-phosphate acyltransferase
MGLTYSLANFLFGFLFRQVYKLEVLGDGPKKYPGGAIIAANHASFYDPPLIGVASMPEEVHFLARNTLFKPFFGWLISNCNAHPVKVASAFNISAMKMLCKIVNSGKKVVIFPEGERTWTGDFSPPKNGVAVVMMRTKCPVIPMYLHGTYDAYPRGRSVPKLKGKMYCVFGKPIRYEEFEHLDRKAAYTAISERIMYDIKELKKCISETN